MGKENHKPLMERIKAHADKRIPGLVKRSYFSAGAYASGSREGSIPLKPNAVEMEFSKENIEKRMAEDAAREKQERMARRLSAIPFGEIR